MEKEELALKGFKRITDSEDGAIRDIRATWPGVLAMLLRKIVIDHYDGKGISGYPQSQLENISYSQMEEIIEETIKRYSGNQLNASEIKNEKGRLLTEFARDALSIKVLGEFLGVLDLEWLDVTLTLHRKSGTIKSYTQHIGGIGHVNYKKPILNEEYYQQLGIHEHPVTVEESIITRKQVKEAKPRRKRGERQQEVLAEMAAQQEKEIKS